MKGGEISKKRIIIIYFLPPLSPHKLIKKLQRAFSQTRDIKKQKIKMLERTNRIRIIYWIKICKAPVRIIKY